MILDGGGIASRPYSTAKDSIEAARRGELPRVVLMDMSLPGESAGAAIQAILGARPEALVVALTSHQREALVFEALRAGAVGYVPWAPGSPAGGGRAKSRLTGGQAGAPLQVHS